MVHYRFKIEEYDRLMDGRSCKWLGEKIGYNNCVLSLIFNGKKLVRKALAIAIVKTMDSSFEVDDFFEKVV